jgi:hypothetical protein
MASEQFWLTAFILMHLSIPILGLLWLANQNERKRLQAERQRLSKLLVLCARGRRR